MGVFSKGLTFLLKDFACWTSTHGIPHIGGSNHNLLRIFWVIVVIACTIAFLVQLKLLIAKYLAFDVNTETKLAFEERPFPVVTICHMNPWKKNQAEGVSDYMDKLMAAYEAQSASTDFGFLATRNGARRQRASRLTTLMSDTLFDVSDTVNGTTADPSYTYSDLVVSCTYNAATCNQSFFASYKDPTFGRCVQFNFNEDQKSSRAGPLYGLRLILRAEQVNYLPWTESAGHVVAIHNKSDVPYPDVVGYYAPIGTASSFGVKYVDTKREPAPYGDCSETSTVSLPNYEGRYQVEACYRACIQDEVIKTCGCYYPGLPYAQGNTYQSCFSENDTSTDYVESSDNLDCIDGVMSGTTFNILSTCTCPQPCEVQTYATTISTAKWPSSGFTPTECREKSHVGQPWMPVGSTQKKNNTLCLEWYKKNTLLIEVYYERMNYQVLSESPAYTFVSCISEIAGNIGLFLGMSIISVFEFFTLFMLIIFYLSSHRSRRQELEAIEEMVRKAEQETEELERREEQKEEERARKRAEKLRAEAEADMYDSDAEEHPLPPQVAAAE